MDDGAMDGCAMDHYIPHYIHIWVCAMVSASGDAKVLVGSDVCGSGGHPNDPGLRASLVTLPECEGERTA